MKSPSRRQMLHATMLGVAGVGAGLGLRKLNFNPSDAEAVKNILSGNDMHRKALPLYMSQRNLLPFNAYDRLADALKGGVSLISSTQAMAAASPSVAFLDVYLDMSADCRHYINVSNFSPANDILTTMTSFGASAAAFADIKVTHPDFSASRVTKWFADIVLKGKGVGATDILGANATVGTTVLAKDIPKEKIAFLTFASYVGTGVHADGALKDAGSISYIAQNAFGMSPNGVAALGQEFNLINEKNQTVASSKATETFLSDLEQFISPSYFHRSLQKEENLILQLDDYIGDERAKKERRTWLEGLEALKQKVASWKAYSDLSARKFNPFAMAGQASMGGETTTGRCAAIALAGDMAKSGLVTVASVGLDSFDFHADAVALKPEEKAGGKGNMMTCMVESAVGLNAWANRLLEANMDGIAFVRTCSGRSADWVKDSSTVSSIAIVVKGRASGPLASVTSAYFGPAAAGSDGSFIEEKTVEWAGGVLGLDGKLVAAASVEGSVLSLLGKALGSEFQGDLGAKIGKII